MKKKDIIPRNGLGHRHGYWEEYWTNGNLYYKGNFINGVCHGSCETYHSNGKPWYKGSYNNGKHVGYWVFYDKNGEIAEETFYA